MRPDRGDLAEGLFRKRFPKVALVTNFLRVERGCIEHDIAVRIERGELEATSLAGLDYEAQVQHALNAVESMYMKAGIVFR